MKYDPENKSSIFEQKRSLPVIGDIFNASAYFNWGGAGVGFGQLSFSFHPETKAITCMNECMNRESVRKILHAFADHIADNAMLDDE